jgi:hypothetical protein
MDKAKPHVNVQAKLALQRPPRQMNVPAAGTTEAVPKKGTDLLPTAVAWSEIAVAGFAHAPLGSSK